MEGGVAKLAGPLKRGGSAVVIRDVGGGSSSGSIPIRAPISEDDDKEGFGTEEEEELDDFGTPVGSFTGNPVAFANKDYRDGRRLPAKGGPEEEEEEEEELGSLAKVRAGPNSGFGTDSDSDSSYSSSASSSSSSSRFPRIRPVAKLSDGTPVRPVAKLSGEDEGGLPAEELVNEEVEEGGFRVVKLSEFAVPGGLRVSRDLGFGKEQGFSGGNVGESSLGSSQGLSKGKEVMGSGSPESMEPSSDERAVMESGSETQSLVSDGASSESGVDGVGKGVDDNQKGNDGLEKGPVTGNEGVVGDVESNVGESSSVKLEGYDNDRKDVAIVKDVSDNGAKNDGTTLGRGLVGERDKEECEADGAEVAKEASIARAEESQSMLGHFESEHAVKLESAEQSDSKQGVISRKDVIEGEKGEQSKSEGLQEPQGGHFQVAAEECASNIDDAKKSDFGLQEPEVNGAPEIGLAEAQTAADNLDESESTQDSLAKENVVAHDVEEVKDAEENLISNANEVASAASMITQQDVGMEDTVEVSNAINDKPSLDSESKQEVTILKGPRDAREIEADDMKQTNAVENQTGRGLYFSGSTVRAEPALDLYGPQSIEELKEGAAQSQRGLHGSLGSEGPIESKGPIANAEGGEGQFDSTNPDVARGLSVDSSSKEDNTQESNVKDAYDAKAKTNQVVSSNSVTGQQTIHKEAFKNVNDQSLLDSESEECVATSEMSYDSPQMEAANMHHTEAVGNQAAKGVDFADGTTVEEVQPGVESESFQNCEESKEGMELPQKKVLGSFESNEHVEQKVPIINVDAGWNNEDEISKPEPSHEDSDTLRGNFETKAYISTGDEDNKDEDSDDEGTLASYANPQFKFESDSGDDSAQKVMGQIVADWDEEADDDDDDDEDEGMVDSSALAALMEAARSAVSGSNNASFGAAGFPVSTRPAGLGSSVPSLDPMPRSHQSRTNAPALSRPSPSVENNLQSVDSLDEYDETQKKLQTIRVKFLRLVQRLGQSLQNVVVTQVLYRLGLAEGLKRGTGTSRAFNSDRANTIAEELEAKQEDLDFTCNILVLGKTGVGKSATINSIFDESKSATNAFQPATDKVREIMGSVHGINVRVVDTPGFMPSFAGQRKNKKIMSSIKRFIKKCPPDIVLYFDRLDVQSRDYSDLPLLKLVTETFGTAIWFNTIVVLTHASSAPPDGANGAPISYEMFVAQRSHIVQHSIRQAAGDMRLMNPVSLVENHSACRRNREGQRVLPNGQVWKPQLLLLCFASKVLAEANALLKLQDNTPGRPFGLRTRAPPLPFLLSSLLQSRVQLKAQDEQNEEDIESDEDLEELSDSEDEDEYDQLPPFKYLTKDELSQLTKEQRKAYDDEIDYREKLYMKKQWKEELRRRRDMKKKKMQKTYNEDADDENPFDEPENPSNEAEPVVMPDMVLPPSFDSENPIYRYRYWDSADRLLVRPVLDTHGWDHDVGYDGVNVEKTLVIGDKVPASISGQITKDKKEANLQLECAASLKHGEHSSTLAGFDVQTLGKSLAYTLRSETRFSNFKRNKTAGGLSLSYLGNTLAGGMKLEDTLMVGKRLKFVVNGGAMIGGRDVAYGGSLEATLRDKDYPVGQTLTTFGLSVMNWHGDLAIGGNLQSQFAVGRKTTMVTRANLNNRGSGQISIRTSSSDQLQIALIGLIPLMRSLLSGRLFGPPYSTQ